MHYSPATLRAKLEQAGFIIENLYTSVGDGAEFFDNTLRQQYPSLNAEELAQKRQELEQGGKGEEIRFFVRKP